MAVLSTLLILQHYLMTCGVEELDVDVSFWTDVSVCSIGTDPWDVTLFFRLLDCQTHVKHTKHEDNLQYVPGSALRVAIKKTPEMKF